VRRAADFIAEFRDEETGRAAPYTPQERWENQAGYSPNSIAAQIDGLVAAAAIARTNGDRSSARRWLRLADRWQGRVKEWTVTTNGPLSDRPYFLRLTKDGDPQAATTYASGDGGPSVVDQRAVVDPSFLDLVRYGILRPHDPAVRSTLRVVDEELSFDTPHGRFWRRFSFDGYGETRTGAQWTITDQDTFTTLGRGWPLLAGERGEYAVTAGRSGLPHLRAMAGAASATGMLSEQVWDGRPPTGDGCCRRGEGTRAATPLTWSHAGLVRLAWTIERGEPVDRLRAVARRYVD
jgi:glucoamylase